MIISARSKLAYKSRAGDRANYNTNYDGANILRTIDAYYRRLFFRHIKAL